jgi:hypothetical protein
MFQGYWCLIIGEKDVLEDLGDAYIIRYDDRVSLFQTLEVGWRDKLSKSVV